MSILIGNVATTDTFQKLLTTVNQLATALSNSVVTVGGNAAIGNSSIIGNFNANSVSTNSISTNYLTLTSNVSNITIAAPTSNQISNGQFYISSNGSWASIQSPTISSSFQSSGLIQQTIDSWPTNVYKTSEYMITAIDNNANNIHATKIMMTFSGSTVLSTEYSTLITNTNLGSFGVSTNGTYISLLVTPTSTNTTFNFTRTSI
jgi:hypothetical protein